MIHSIKKNTKLNPITKSRVEIKISIQDKIWHFLSTRFVFSEFMNRVYPKLVPLPYTSYPLRNIGFSRPWQWPGTLGCDVGLQSGRCVSTYLHVSTSQEALTSFVLLFVRALMILLSRPQYIVTTLPIP